MLEQIRQYRILRELGGGGFAKVYLAMDEQLHREVAIKVLHTTIADNPDFRRFFEREARLVASFERLAVVPVYDFGEADGSLFLVMRYMRGGSLAERMDAGKKAMPLADVIALLERLAPTLDAIHASGVVHRDLKPANILYDEADAAYIADFGIARIQQATTQFTRAGMTFGTPQYSSPEQVTGEGVLDHHSDIYSLGIILFQLLTTEYPFWSDTPLGWVNKHAQAPIPDILALNNRLPAALSDIMRRLLAKSPADRYHSVSAVLEDFKRAQAGLPVAVAAPRGSDAETRIIAPPPPPEPRPRETVAPQPAPPRQSASAWVNMLTLGLMGGAGILFLVLLALGVTLWRSNNAPDSPTPVTGSAPTASPPATQDAGVARATPTDAPVLSTAAPASPTTPAATATSPSPPDVSVTGTALALTAFEQLPAPVRNRPIVYAPYTQTAPTLDGVLDEWQPGAFVKVSHIGFRPELVSGEQDLSGECALRWNEEALFVACRVRDDVLAQESSGNRLYEGDSLELYFDTRVMQDRDDAEMNRDDFQIGILPGALFNRANEVYLWFPRDEERYLDSVTVESRPTTEGYQVELSVPWRELQIERPKANEMVGFGLNVNDNDTVGSAAQESQLNLFSSHQWATPTSWGLLVLLKQPD